VALNAHLHVETAGDLDAQMYCILPMKKTMTKEMKERTFNSNKMTLEKPFCSQTMLKGIIRLQYLYLWPNIEFSVGSNW
jgi:predicted metal-binding transcription factor (methanogenesis marker protein 9)